MCCNVLLCAQAQEKTFQDFEIKFSASPLEISLGEISYYLVKLKKGVTHSDLIRHDVRFWRFLNKTDLIVEKRALEADFLFEKVTPANHLWKLSEGLIDKKPNHDREVFTIRTNKENEQPIFTSYSDIDVLRVHEKQIVIRCPYQTLIDKVIPQPEVVYAGLESQQAKVESRVLDLNLEPNAVYRTLHAFPQINGAGITISIKELAFNPNDLDLWGRAVPSELTSAIVDAHATDMATIAAGAGNSFVTGRGVAREASVTSSDFLIILPDTDEAYQSLDAYVQNHSYGTEIENFYGTIAEAFDASANRNNELLHVFSSGNKGTSTSESGTYAGIANYANLTGNFKMAKNVLVVGSVDTIGRTLAFASRGPAYDGRIKPEVVTYSMTGTSNSAALVSGIVALLQQEYKQRTGVLPASALLKAALINGARDVGSPGIDFITGFGNVDAFESMTSLAEERYINGSVSNDEVWSTTLNVPANSKELKLTIVWNDPAAMPNSNKALVHDLDMAVIDPNNITWQPWILNSAPSQLQQPAIRGEDHINNVEQISIDQPVSGTYTITVTGTDVSVGPQDFYLVYQFKPDNTFDWAYPTASDNMPYNGETGTYFRWNSTLADQFGRLEYSVDNWATWEVIKDGIDLRQGYWRWDPPFINSKAQARMVVGNSNFNTDMFTISRPLPIRVGFACGDSLLIHWNRLPNLELYDIQTQAGNYLQTFRTTSDTAVILSRITYPSQYFAVQPKLADGTSVIRSYALDYTLQGIGCYIQSFIAYLQPSEGINLVLSVGTTYGIQEVIFEREQQGSFIQIGSVVMPTNLQATFFDEHPRQGFNTYRARIKFINGEEVVSETDENYFLTTTPFLIFPNPVNRSQELSIVSRPFTSQEKVFTLFRLDGREVLSKPLVSEYDFVSLSEVTPGLYLYVIQTVEGRFMGKLVVRE
jgi:hypothetical protein